MAARGAARPAARGQWAVLVFLLLVVGVVVGVLLLATRGSGGSLEPYSLRSAAPSGLLGLRLWLEEMGYKVRAGNSPDSSPADVVFLFPDANLTADQVSELSHRVEEGRTLVLAGADSPELSRKFGALIQRGQPIADEPLRQAQPILTGTQALEGEPASGRSLSAMPGANLTPILTTSDGKVAVFLQQRMRGAVWQVGLQAAFTNEELKAGWGRALVLAALRGKPSGSTVYIVNGESESPSGQPAAPAGETDGLAQWLVRNPLGWAALLFAGLIMLYLFLQGRRLGPAVAVSDPHRRRAAVEHIEAMARLSQRAGHREGVARYQKARLKRRLGQGWRVSADLDDAAFVSTLAERARLSPEKAASLAEMLAQFDHVTDESGLVQLVDAAGRFTLE